MLSIILISLLAAIVMLYVVFDGFDIGVGILFPFVNHESHRDILLHAIAPVVDGNETWLVLGAVVLYSAFPIAYGLLLPILYTPLLLMLAAVIFRVVSYEYRLKTKSKQFLWNLCFHLSSVLVAFLQGLILGAFIQGFDQGDIYTISMMPWFTPFSVMVGFFLIFGYALLGSTWLIIRTQGELQSQLFLYSRRLLVMLSLGILVVSLWTPFHNQVIFNRWFTIPNVLYLAPVPGLTLVGISYTWFCLQNRFEVWPYSLTLFVFMMSYIGIGISLFPYIIPHQVSYWDAAAPNETQLYVLYGLSVVLPIILVYSIYAYRVFRRKANLDETY